jgi:DNA-directed RNA polymerase specialized sigma24 family protein
VRETLEKLPDKERIVLTLYYYEELTLKEIGEVLGISESRVCQVHTKAVIRLRGRINQHIKTVSLKHLSARIKRAGHKKTTESQIA